MGRAQPLAGAHAYKTYSVSAPLATHWRVATCGEVGCPREEFGWTTVVLEADDLGQAQAHYIRTSSGRKFTESRREDGMTVFEFPPGQRCFSTLVRDGRVVSGHPKRIERPELFIVRDGDWRGNPRGTSPLVHSGPESWVDDFATHQQTLADAANEG
jgi:hypothetical protein